MSPASPLSSLFGPKGFVLDGGQLGLIFSPPGLGKSALLAQLGLDALLSEVAVLHVAVGERGSEVRARYAALLADRQRRGLVSDTARQALDRRLFVQSYGRSDCSSARVTSALGVLAEHAQFRPGLMLVDGLDWQRSPRAQLASWRALAWAHGARMWLSATSRRAADQLGPEQLPGLLSGISSLADRALQIRAQGAQVEVRDLSGGQLSPEPILLDSTFMRAPGDEGAGMSPESLEPTACTLFSGGAVGSEARFGECAERFGLNEVHFSYPGHEPFRTRGLRVLSELELRKGDVSIAYANRRLSRVLQRSHSMRRVLQTQWHQVHKAEQVFVVGELRDDGTLRGGTGWAGELARMWGKELLAFDQLREHWYRWEQSSSQWQQRDPPRIVRARFCGTGTRHLNAAGKAAIEALFAASFSAPAVVA